MKLGEPKIKNVIPDRAALLSPEECATATGHPVGTIKAAIASGALPSKNGEVETVDLIRWRNKPTL